MNASMLELRDVHATYLQKEILRGVSLTVHAGEIVAILGENGSGKSSTLKIVAGLLRTSKGSVHYQGRDLNGCAVTQRQRLGIGYVMQGGRVFPNLTVRENFEIAAAETRRAGREPARLGQWFPLLCERQRDRAALLSGGQRQMLAVEMVLTQRPKLLLLDEPTGALTEPLALEILTAIRKCVANGSTAAVLVEQNSELALATSTRALHLKQGRMDGEIYDSNK